MILKADFEEVAEKVWIDCSEKRTKGKIDYIITKSISRVSRDTLEVLKITRFLSERGINMHFERKLLFVGEGVKP